MSPRRFTLNFLGDVMLGRLVDQMYPDHVDCPDEARIAKSLLRTHHGHLSHFTPETPWGDTLDLFRDADLNIINLETAVTTHAHKWPDKAFNYRMHPANIAILRSAHIHYAGLANNHTLDFCEPGLIETVRTVKKAGIAFAGAGETAHEATRPAILRLPHSSSTMPPTSNAATEKTEHHNVHVYAASDHPSEWSSIPTFHHIDYSSASFDSLTSLLHSGTSDGQSPSLKIFSVHWGPNYTRTPSSSIRGLAHHVIDNCGVDIVHGHSSHHIQGVEIYRGKVILYGCGDFVDDYAVVSGGWRNDLGGLWRVIVQEDGGNAQGETGGGTAKLNVTRVEVWPTKIEGCAVRRLKVDESDARWLRHKMKQLCEELGTRVEVEESGEGRVIISVS